MVRIGLPRRPGPLSSTTTLYLAPNAGPSSNIHSSADSNQLYGIQLYGPDASHIRFAATQYGTEARRLLLSLLPTTPSATHTTKSGANNHERKERIEETTNRALVYAAESRRLLATAQTLEASSDVLSKTFAPPSPRYKFSCALNLITTDLTPSDAEMAAKFVHYAQQASELYAKGAGYAGDDRVERCEYECKRIIDACVPNELVDDKSMNKSNRKMGGQRGRRYTTKRVVVVLGAMAAMAGTAGYALHRHKSSASRGGRVSSATESDWNDIVEGTSTPTAFPTLSGMPTAEPTVYDNASAPAAAPVDDEDNGESDAMATVRTYMDEILSNPWAVGILAGALSFAVLGLVTWVILLRRNPTTKSEPLIDVGEVGREDNGGDGEDAAKKHNDDMQQKPAAVAVAVGVFPVDDDPDCQTEVVVEEAAAAPCTPAQPPQATPVATGRPPVQHTKPAERSQARLRRALSAKERVQQMIEAEQLSRARMEAAVDDGKRPAVRFRSGDDSLVSDTGVPHVPTYSQSQTRGYVPPPPAAPIPAVSNDGDVESGNGQPLPPLQLQK